MLAANERDRLLGAEAITNFINSEVLDPECAVTLKAVQHWIDRDILPTGRFGRQIIGSKAEIRAALAGQPLPMPQGHQQLTRPRLANRRAFAGPGHRSAKERP